MTRPFEREFLLRLSWTLASDHFRHGWIGKAEIEGDDGGPNPTYTGDDPGSFQIRIVGECPCGEKVYRSSEGMYESADLIRFITTDSHFDDMAKDMNPFVDYEREL